MPKPKAPSVWQDPSVEWFYMQSLSWKFGELKKLPRGTDPGACPEAMRRVMGADADARGLFDLGSSHHLVTDKYFFNRHDRSCWPTRLEYRCPQPDQSKMPHLFIEHHKVCLPEDYDWFPECHVVSHEWRQLVEDLEPGRAKFFPVELAFKDKKVDGYSWMIAPDRGFPRPLSIVAGKWITGHEWMSDDVPGKLVPSKLEIPRTLLTGMHWAPTWWHDFFVSAQALRRIEPLILPQHRKNALKHTIPVTVIEP